MLEETAALSMFLLQDIASRTQYFVYLGELTESVVSWTLLSCRS